MQYVRLKIIRNIEERKRLASTFAKKFGHLTRHETANLPCVDDVFRDKLFNLIEAQYSDSNFKIELMSDMLGMSRILLYRKITSIFGMSPSDLLRNFRLQKAIQLINRSTTQCKRGRIYRRIFFPCLFCKMLQKRLQYDCRQNICTNARIDCVLETYFNKL